MKNVYLKFLFSVSLIVLIVQNGQSQPIEQWRRVGNANWSHADGLTTADEGNVSFLVTPRKYKDFRLTLEFFPGELAIGGIFFDCPDSTKIDRATSYKVNIYDNRPAVGDQPSYRTGSIVDVAPPKKIINTIGQWNTYDITVKGNHFIVKLNGIITVDVVNNKFKGPGYVAIQYGRGIIAFRNVKIAEL